MTIVDQIYAEAQVLPDELAREVLGFIGFIESKYDVKSVQDRDLQNAQGAPMAWIWDNQTGLSTTKKRPVLVLTGPGRHGDFIGITVTSVPQPDPHIAIGMEYLSQGVLLRPRWVRVD